MQLSNTFEGNENNNIQTQFTGKWNRIIITIVFSCDNNLCITSKRSSFAPYVYYGNLETKFDNYYQSIVRNICVHVPHLTLCFYHGQWWSILLMQRLQIRQWWARGGRYVSHLVHSVQSSLFTKGSFTKVYWQHHHHHTLWINKILFRNMTSC